MVLFLLGCLWVGFGEIQAAIREVNDIIEKFSNVTADLLQAVNLSIENVERTSEKSVLIQDSMNTVSQIAEHVQEVIEQTNSILN